MKQRVVAFVDHEIGYRLLQKLISFSERGDIQLVAVVTTHENGRMWWPGVEGLCNEAGIALLRYEDPFPELLSLMNISWYFLLSWKHVLPNVLIDYPINGVINLHYSLLPEYRGVYPTNWAIIDGNEKTGVTYHLVGGDIDCGKILLQKTAPISQDDTARSLQLRLDDLAFELFDSLLDHIVKNKIDKKNGVVGDVVSGSYKSRKDFQAVCEIDLNRSYRAGDLINLLRGMTFLPDSKNAFFVDPLTEEKIYISVILERKHEQK